MKRFLIILFTTVLLACAAQVAIVLGTDAVIPAEYWVREMIGIKETLADERPSPKIVFLGGSSTLFSIDALHVEQALGRPAMNMGLHAGLSLDRLLIIGRRSARRGDMLILALEPNYYSCSGPRWTDWRVRNALAWDREAYFNLLPLPERIAAVLEAGDPSLPLDAVAALAEEKLGMAVIQKRKETIGLQQMQKDLASIRAHVLPDEFVYSAANIDSNGDIQNISGQHYFGAAHDAALPAGVCSQALAALSEFNREMTAKGVSVAIVNTPYLVLNTPRADWMAAERKFTSDLASAGLPVLDRRSDLFFPPEDFFNMEHHLNAQGRRQRTDKLIAALAHYGAQK